MAKHFSAIRRRGAPDRGDKYWYTEFQRACGRSTALQLQPSVSTKRILSSTTYIDNGDRPALLSLLPFQGVDFYGKYSFRYLRQKCLHFWSYSHHPFYLQLGALSIKEDLQTRPKRKPA